MTKILKLFQLISSWDMIQINAQNVAAVGTRDNSAQTIMVSILANIKELFFA
jgi:hypothetical protein